jgi:putative phosphoribosyl transferase
MGEVHIAEYSWGPVLRYRDRADAGRRLAEWIAPRPDPRAVVFALPRGGIPVARALADALGCELRPALVRKLPIPSDPEMGFGAVTVDGTVTLNHDVMRVFGITPEVAETVATEVRAEVERRGSVYPGGWPLPSLGGHRVWMVDDGLATGYSMLASLQMLRKHGAGWLGVTVPCSPIDSLARIEPLTDETWCLIAQRGRGFAVASFYADFHDLSDAEVTGVLGKDAVGSTHPQPQPDRDGTHGAG